jgi:hypothetical protein
MSWLNRLKLFSGIIVVLIIVGLLTILFNQRQNQIASVAAYVDSPRSVLASPYAGTVTDQKHGPGDAVSVGDELFTITSTNLKDMAALGVKPTNTESYKTDLDTGTITFYATSDGYLDNFTAFLGSSVNGTERLTEIVSSKNKTVVARFFLNPADYGRIEPNGRVVIHLTNGQAVEGQVMSVNISNDEKEGRTVTAVTVSSEGLQHESLDLLTRRNTPVSAVLSLRDDGPLAGPTQALQEFLVKIGLR